MTMYLFLIFSEHPWDKIHANPPHLQFLTNNCVYSSHTYIKLYTYCLYRHTTVLIHEILYWPIDIGILTSLLLPHLSLSLTDSLPSLNLLYHSKTDARFMQDGQKAVWSITYVSVTFFQSLKHNFIAYRSSKVSSRPDCIFEIHQLWETGFSKVSSKSWCLCSFEPEIIKISQSSHKMYSNYILNFQESMTILNGCTKTSGSLLNVPCTCRRKYTSIVRVCNVFTYKYTYRIRCLCENNRYIKIWQFEKLEREREKDREKEWEREWGRERAMEGS